MPALHAGSAPVVVCTSDFNPNAVNLRHAELDDLNFGRRRPRKIKSKNEDRKERRKQRKQRKQEAMEAEDAAGAVKGFFWWEGGRVNK
jgi:hypothetical protein